MASVKKTLAFVLFLAMFWQPAWQPATTPPQTRAGSWTQSIALSDAASPRMLSSQQGSSTADNDEGYLSPIVRADFPFNALGVQWQGEFEPGEKFVLEVKISSDGKEWSPWYAVRGIDQYLGASPQASDLVFATGNYFQYRLYPTPLPPAADKMTEEPEDLLSGHQVNGASPEKGLAELTFTYIDSSQGPSLTEARSAAKASPSVAGARAPTIIPRSAWGADESYRFNKGKEIWTPKIVPAKKITVHHTATSNSDPNPAATMRAIYYYHAVTQKWGDIGYNYVVDRYGNIYEGRYGGADVVAAHVYGHNEGNMGVAALGTYASSSISKELEGSLVSLLAWEAARRGIDPLGSSFFVDMNLPNILGHREAVTTTCPGDNLFDYLPRVRTQVKGLISPYYVSWIKHNTPNTMAPGRTITVSVTLRNSGTITWEPGGLFPFRLGYKWYTKAGTLYRQTPAEDIRTSVGRRVAPGEEITLSAFIVAPKDEGDYILRWDMEQRYQTWFADKGSPPLEVAVRVTEPIYGVAWGAQDTPTTMVAGETTLVSIEVENQGKAGWTTNGPRPIRIGYRWYNSSGQQYIQSGYTQIRSGLPRDVGPRQKVRVLASLTAPSAPGTYVLHWDMVHENVTWFSQQGEKTLNVLVRVLPAPLAISPNAVATLVVKGAGPLRQTISLSPTASSRVSWNLIPSPVPWLRVEPRSGSAPASITLEIDPSNMNTGTQLQKITLLVNPEGSRRYSVVIPVQIIVAEESRRLFLPVWR